MEIHRNYLSSLSLVLALAGCAEDGPEPDFGPGVDLPGDETGETDDGTGGGSGSGGGTSAGDDSDGGGGTGGGTSGGLDEDGDGCISPHEIELPRVFPDELKTVDPTGYREYGPDWHTGRPEVDEYCPPCPHKGLLGNDKCLTGEWLCGCRYGEGPTTRCLEYGTLPDGEVFADWNVFTCVFETEPCPVEYVHCDPTSEDYCGPDDLYPGDAYMCGHSSSIFGAGQRPPDAPWECWGFCG